MSVTTIDADPVSIFKRLKEEEYFELIIEDKSDWTNRQNVYRCIAEEIIKEAGVPKHRGGPSTTNESKWRILSYGLDEESYLSYEDDLPAFEEPLCDWENPFEQVGHWASSAEETLEEIIKQYAENMEDVLTEAGLHPADDVEKSV